MLTRGIGTTAPGSLLTVVSGDVSIFSSKCGGTAGQANLTDGILRFGKNFDNSGTKTANKIILYDDGGVGAQWKGGFGVNSNSIDFFSGDNFNFWTNHGSVDQGNNRFTILAGGNVGIGTDALIMVLMLPVLWASMTTSITMETMILT